MTRAGSFAHREPSTRFGPGGAPETHLFSALEAASCPGLKAPTPFGFPIRQ